MDNDVFESRRERAVVDNRKKAPKMLIPIIIILLLVVGGVGAYFVMNKNASTPETTENVSPTSAPIDEPEPTEEEIDLKEYKIMVINGTEVAGEAGKLKTTLTDAGFDVTSVGNADKTTYTKTIIQAKSTVKAGFIEKLKSEISGTYEIGTDETLDDEDENNVDVKIIIGIPEDKQKESSDEADTDETPTPEAEETDTPTPTKSE
jgi:hypothetical protein